jgi:hypothetical protein
VTATVWNAKRTWLQKLSRCNPQAARPRLRRLKRSISSRILLSAVKLPANIDRFCLQRPRINPVILGISGRKAWFLQRAAYIPLDLAVRSERSLVDSPSARVDCSASFLNLIISVRTSISCGRKNDHCDGVFNHVLIANAIIDGSSCTIFPSFYRYRFERNEWKQLRLEAVYFTDCVVRFGWNAKIDKLGKPWLNHFACTL